MRQELRASVAVVDMRKKNGDAEEQPMPLFSPEALSAILHAVQEKRRVFIFCVRKGFAPFTVCRDCGHIYTCDRCDAPMVLYGKNDTDERRVFRCSRCGRTKDAQTVCTQCGSWRLASYGVGIEHVVAHLAAHVPGVPVFSMSRDTVTTPQQAQKLIDAWQSSAPGILVGTQMVLPFLRTYPPHISVIASLDTLTFLPDFAIGERVFHIVSSLAAMTEDRLVVQTRTPDFAPLAYAVSGDGAGMYKYEDSIRKEFSYPPYSVFIKITRRGKKEAVVADLTALKGRLSGYSAALYPAFVSKIKNIHSAHLLLSVPEGAWPDEAVAAVLRSLPPQYIVDVDPETLL
jgi:primosomal protein N' (replication factor Y)